jgi:hypothetical protein
LTTTKDHPKPHFPRLHVHFFASTRQMYQALLAYHRDSHLYLYPLALSELLFNKVESITSKYI